MKLQLKVRNKKYSGWQNIIIVKSMQSIAHTFAMDIYKGADVDIQDDDIVQILKDDEVFFTGYIDGITLRITDAKMPMQISGRSKTCDLIDCNIEINKQYNQQNIKQIISDLIKPFGITVSSILTLDALEVFNTKVGETYFDAINRLCKQTNTLPISDNFGNIEIIKNKKSKASIVLKDQDFKEINYPKKLDKRFSKYTYKKEGIITDITDGVVKDSTVKRYRPFVAVNTDDKDNQDLAKWELNKNKADEANITAIIQGWDIDINTIVKVETSIINNSFLVKEIIYYKDDSGTRSELTLIDKDLYNVE